MSTPEFVYNGKLTDEGRKIVEHINTVLDEAESLIEGQNMAPLNALSGPYQDYYVNVRKAGLHTPDSWVKDRAYAAFRLWTLITEQENAAQKEQQVDTLEVRLAKLEEQMTKALETIQAKDAEIARLKETTVENETVVDAETVTKPRKAKKTQEPEPAEPAAETSAEGEPDETEDNEAES